MARIRTIKPEFFTDSKITSLTPLARLFYVSLWCESDRQGRLKWDPTTLKYRYLPADKAKVEDLGDELLSAGLIRLYEVNGQVYAEIPGFIRHQVINNREAESSFPAWTPDACVTRESGVSDAACGKEGREGKGRKGTTPIVPKGTDEPKGFQDLMAVYPKREGTNPRPRALRAWHDAIARGANPEQIIEAAKAYARTEVAGTKYTQQTSTWLNGDEWKNQAAVAGPTVDPEDSRWALRLDGFDRRRFWNHDQWGPPPDQPGCKAPQRLLESRQVAA